MWSILVTYVHISDRQKNFAEKQKWTLKYLIKIKLDEDCYILFRIHYHSSRNVFYLMSWLDEFSNKVCRIYTLILLIFL